MDITLDITVYNSNIIIQVFERENITWCKYVEISIYVSYFKLYILNSLNSFILFFFYRKNVYYCDFDIRKNKIELETVINKMKLLFITLAML